MRFIIRYIEVIIVGYLMDYIALGNIYSLYYSILPQDNMMLFYLYKILALLIYIPFNYLALRYSNIVKTSIELYKKNIKRFLIITSLFDLLFVYFISRSLLITIIFVTTNILELCFIKPKNISTQKETEEYIKDYFESK